MPTDDGGHLLIPAIYGEFVEVFSNEPESLAPHRSIDHAIELERGYNLPYGRITIVRSFQLMLSWVERYSRNCVDKDHVLKSRIMDLDLEISCHMDESMSGYFLIMDDMSPDYGTAMKSQWRQTLWRSVRWPLESLQCYRSSHGMQPIWAQLRTWWKRMAGTNWISTGDRSRPEMDHGRRWITLGDGSQEMDPVRRWIAAGCGSRPDLDEWEEMDLRRWIATGYGWMTRGG